MKGKDLESSRSRRRRKRGPNNTRWGKRGRCSGSELVDISGCPLSTTVYVPTRVMESSTLSIKGASFPKGGSKMLGTRYGSHLLSLFRLYVVKNGSHDTLSPIIWLDIALQGFSFGARGLGGGFSVDLYAHGGAFYQPVWICRLQSTRGMFYSGQGIPQPTI